MLIKVSGLREPDNIRRVMNLGVDLLGLVFYKESPHSVSYVDSRAGIIPDRVDKHISEALSSGETCRVGAFLDAMPQVVVTAVYNFALDYVQLDGEESPIYIDNLRHTLDPDIRPNVKIIKTVKVSTVSDIRNAEVYEGRADMLLFTFEKHYDPANTPRLDFSVLEAYSGSTPFLIGGSVCSDDVERILRFRHTHFLGVDVGQCFESSPTIIDIDKLTLFIKTIRK